ncbi:MAG: hypothetical protein L0Y50_01910 [Beijerinckiaceae bacterium]|nr:hypothetical protein [Beijerinckiaceae bacterium]MCI0735026.1 hypothetical protein [Beijerinckiaceae bacterium]
MTTFPAGHVTVPVTTTCLLLPPGTIVADMIEKPEIPATEGLAVASIRLTPNRNAAAKLSQHIIVSLFMVPLTPL